MLVITVPVGGQEVHIALAKADIWRGLVVGACVAGIAMIIDRLIVPWAAGRTHRLGSG
jgi:ABC-type proline/glycine betaine transport system permease subunit